MGVVKRKRMEKIKLKIKYLSVRQDGFSAIELAVVAAVIVMLTILLFPRFAALTIDARQSELRQDARSIQAAIELVKIEGRFDNRDEKMTEAIQDYIGKKLTGRVSSVTQEGSFIYTKDVDGYRYQIAYNYQNREFIELERRQLVYSE